MSDVSIGLVCLSPVRPSEVFAEGLGFQHYRGPHVRQFAEIVDRLEIRRAQLQVESFHCSPFRFVQWVHSSTMTNVSLRAVGRKAPCHPRRSDFFASGGLA